MSNDHVDAAQPADKPVQFHKIKVRNDGCAGWSTRVWIDGKEDVTVTHLSLDVNVSGIVTATVTFLAEVDAETLALATAVRPEPVGGGS